MASLTFQLIGTNIYANLSVGRGKTFRRKTGLTSNPDLWATKKSKRENRIADLTKPTDASSKELKRKTLDPLQENLLNQFNEDYSNGIEINAVWFENAIKTHTNQEGNEKEYFTYQIQKAIDNAPRKKVRTRGGKYKIGLSKQRIKGIAQFRNIIERFEDEHLKGTRIKVSNIDLNTVSDFEKWLFKKGYSINTIGKHLTNFKAILNEINDVQVNINTSDIRVISEEKNPEDIIYLSFAELQKIKELKLFNNYLENARKWLILGCYTGQRASDLLRLSPKHIAVINGRKVFQIRQQKTKTPVTIPILPEAETVINSGFPHPISQTKLREYFKEVCRLAGIDEPTNGRIREEANGISIKGTYPKWKLIGTHVCRRSFASNYYGIIPTVVLKGITGHATEQMFLTYIGKTDGDLSMLMYDYIDKLPKSKTMEVVRHKSNTGTDSNI